MLLQRVLEPEVMDTLEEVIEYDAMDFIEVNTAFAERTVELAPPSGLLLDVGTGTARIPILICQRCPQLRVTGVDLGKNMLLVGSKNVEDAGLQEQITLELSDAKELHYNEQKFDMIISNSIVHHLPNPLLFCLEIKRVLKPNGAILVRDLIRPIDEAAMNKLVEKICTKYNENQKQLVRESFHAALTLDEVNIMVQKAQLQNVKVYQSSEVHWTFEKKYVG